MNNIPTAEEFLLSFDKDLRKQITPYMRQFTKLHVEAVVTKLTEAQYDRASSKLIKDLVKEKLNDYYPLNNIL